MRNKPVEKRLLTIILSLVLMLSFLSPAMATEVASTDDINAETETIAVANTEAGPQRIDIFNFADFHGMVDFDPLSASDPGAARFVSYLQWQRSLNPNPNNTVVIPGGDDFHGRALSNLFRGEPVLEMMKYLGVQYAAFGNHELSFGETRARELGRGHENGGVTFLAADLFYAADHPNVLAGNAVAGTQPSFVQPYAILEFEDHDITIGLVGLMNLGMRTLVAGGMSGFDLRTPTAAANPAFDAPIHDIISKLRNEYGVNAVVAVTHLGGGTNHIADRFDIDAMIGGHGHTVQNRDRNGVPIQEIGHHGRNLGRISLNFDAAGNLTGTTRWASPSNAIRDFYRFDLATPTQHPEFVNFRHHFDAMNEMIARYEARAGVDEPIGPYGVYFGNRNERDFWVTRLVHDYVVRWGEETEGESDVWVGVSNSGGWRNTNLWPMNADAPVTMRHLLSTMPFDNCILLFEMHGQDLNRLLNGSPTPVRTGVHGSTNNWFITATGERIVNDRTKTYNVIGTNFIYGGFGVAGGDSFPLPGNNHGNNAGMQFLSHPRVLMEDGSTMTYPELLALTSESAAWEQMGVRMLRNALADSSAWRGETPNDQWQAELTVRSTAGGSASITSPFAPGNRARNMNIIPTWVTVTATAPQAGYAFQGWFNGDEQVSADRVYSFAIFGNTSLVARYCLAEHVPGERVVTLEPTRTEEGAWLTRCEVCEAVVETGSIKKLKVVGAATSVNDFISIQETSKNSRVWVLTFKAEVELANEDGEIVQTEIVEYSVNLSGNNANLDGRFAFGEDHELAGFTLNYDIKGNGSNIKELRLS